MPIGGDQLIAGPPSLLVLDYSSLPAYALKTYIIRRAKRFLLCPSCRLTTAPSKCESALTLRPPPELLT